MWYPLLTYIGTGIIAGSLSGLLGIGGGVIVVPLLALAFYTHHYPSHLIMHLAIASSLASMVATTGFSLLGHYRRGAVIWPIYRSLAPGIIIGAVAGTLLAHNLPTHILKMIFGIFLLLVASYLFFADRLPRRQHLPKLRYRFLLSLVIGGKSGLLGVGGGTITVPFLTYCRVNMRDIVGISAACGFTIAIISTSSFLAISTTLPDTPAWTTGYINWPAVIAIASTSPWFALLGTQWSRRLPTALLRKIFAGFILAAALHMLL